MARERVERDEEDLVRLYLTDIGQYTLLTKDDEVDLAQKIEAGIEAREELAAGKSLRPARRVELRRLVQDGEQAERQFVQSNLRLVVSIAKKYQASGLPLLDLVQEGNLGLMHAVEKFDWRKGFKFSTYATWWIRQAITRGLGNQARTIRLPVHMVDIVRTVNETVYTLTEELRRRPTREEIAAASGLDIDRVTTALATPTSTISIDRPVGEDGDAVLGDFVADKTAIDPFAHAAAAVRRARIEEALSILTDDERTVVVSRYGLGGTQMMTLTDIGARMGVTREHIRQIERRALSKLRHPSNAYELKTLIDL